MRTIGNLDNAQAASRFGDYLYVHGIENEIEQEDDGRFSIWVIEDEHLPRATELLQRFRANPAAAEFQAAGNRARDQRAREEKAERSRRATFADTARIGYERHFRGSAVLTIALIVLCVAVAIYTRLGSDYDSLHWLKISEYLHRPGLEAAINLRTEDYAPGVPFLTEIRSGQIWRLITPILLHFGPIHLIFNIMMLKELGTFIEGRFGALYLGLLVLVSAILPNLAQALWGNPNFGGMSGVNYALFGFLWIRGRFDRRAAWSLNKNTVAIMLIWLVLGFTGLLGLIANTVHCVGLGVGMLWGFVTARR